MAKRTCVLGILAILALGSFVQALERQPSSDYHARREKLGAKLDGGVALVFAPAEAEGPNDVYGYRPDNNFYYLTGWPEPGAALLVAGATEAKGDAAARKYTEILFLPKRNYSQERWTGPKLGPDDPKAAELAGVDRVEPLDNLRDELVKLPHGREMKIYTDVPAGEDTSNSTAPLSWSQPPLLSFPPGSARTLSSRAPHRSADRSASPVP